MLGDGEVRMVGERGGLPRSGFALSRCRYPSFHDFMRRVIDCYWRDHHGSVVLFLTFFVAWLVAV